MKLVPTYPTVRRNWIKPSFKLPPLLSDYPRGTLKLVSAYRGGGVVRCNCVQRTGGRGDVETSTPGILKLKKSTFNLPLPLFRPIGPTPNMIISDLLSTVRPRLKKGHHDSPRTHLNHMRNMTNVQSISRFNLTFLTCAFYFLCADNLV